MTNHAGSFSDDYYAGLKVSEYTVVSAILNNFSDQYNQPILMINKTNEWYIIRIIGMIKSDSGGYNDKTGGLSGSVIVYYI